MSPSHFAVPRTFKPCGREPSWEAEMSESKYIEFARRHADPIMQTLNPQSVLQRIEELIDQINQIKIVVELQDGVHFHKWNILNYYIVAATTCLEWHARGRLVDFVSSMPEKIESSDFANLKNSALNIARNTKTTAQLIGAIKSISSEKEYISVFDRIFLAIKSDSTAWDLIRDFVIFNGSNNLERLFEDRHALVHEIGIREIGPFLLRDPFDFDDAISVLEMVRNIIISIENVIKDLAPPDFPNVDEAGSEADRMLRLIHAVELEIGAILSDHSDDLAAWKILKSNWAAAWEIEENAIRSMGALRPVRWIDYRSAIIEKLLRERYYMLKYIKEKISE